MPPKGPKKESEMTAEELELARRNLPPTPDAIPNPQPEEGSLIPGNFKVE